MYVQELLGRLPNEFFKKLIPLRSEFLQWLTKLSPVGWITAKLGNIFRSEASYDCSSSFLLGKFSSMNYLLLATSKIGQMASSPGDSQINSKMSYDA